MNKYIFGLSILALSLSFVACNNDDDDPVTEQELITSVELTIAGPGINNTYTFEDLDGDGGNPPTIPTVALPPLTGNLTFTLRFLDRSKNPEENITEEIEDEKEEHLVVYEVFPNLDLEFKGYADSDNNGQPLGLLTNWQTDQPGTDTLKVTLYHEPTNKANLADPGGEVDVEALFLVRVQ